MKDTAEGAAGAARSLEATLLNLPGATREARRDVIADALRAAEAQGRAEGLERAAEALAEKAREAAGRALRAREDDSCDDATVQHLRSMADGWYAAEKALRALAPGNAPKAPSAIPDSVPAKV